MPNNTEPGAKSDGWEDWDDWFERPEVSEPLAEVEDPGPEPVEYKPVLLFAIVLVVLAAAWAWLYDPASALLAPWLP